MPGLGPAAATTGPDGARRCPPISRPLAGAGLRKINVADPLPESLRCWGSLCPRLGGGLRREGSNHERRRRQRWQEGQESHLALLYR